MKKLLGLLAVFAGLILVAPLGSPAWAQTATVVASCDAVASIPTGVNGALVMDQAGRLCSTSSSVVNITVAQTVTASSAYASGNAVGGLITFPAATRVTAGGGLIQSALEYAKSAQTSPTDLFVFNANPSGSTCTDKTAFSLATADFDKVVAVVHITDWTSAGTPSTGQALNLAVPFQLPAGTSLFACAVTRGTPTFAATSDVSLGLRIFRY